MGESASNHRHPLDFQHDARPCKVRGGQQIAKLRVFMPTWEQAARLDWDRMQRPLLCDYVQFLLVMGMRHGTESMTVRWCDCEW